MTHYNAVKAGTQTLDRYRWVYSRSDDRNNFISFRVQTDTRFVLSVINTTPVAVVGVWGLGRTAGNLTQDELDVLR